MIQAGVITGVIMFVLVFVAGFVLSPVCSLCVPLIAGLAAGFLAGVFEKPAADRASRRGALAGLIAGGIAIPGNMIAAVINALVLQDASNQYVNQLLDLPTATPALVWAVQLGLSLCVGLLNLGLMGLLGMGGAAIWSSTLGKGPAAPPPDAPQPG